MFIFYAASAVFSCPLAMADGAARVLEVHGAGNPVAMEHLEKLLSRDPKVELKGGGGKTRFVLTFARFSSLLVST